MTNQAQDLRITKSMQSGTLHKSFKREHEKAVPQRAEVRAELSSHQHGDRPWHTYGDVQGIRLYFLFGAWHGSL